MSNLTVENVYTRQSAKELTKKHFWKLLGMMGLISLIIIAVVFGGMFLLALVTGADLTTTMTTSSYYAPPMPPVSFWVGYILLSLVITLVSSGLTLGMTSAMIDLCRGHEDVTIGRVFGHMGQCLKAMGLDLWIGLKVFLWMLPGYAVVMLCAVIGASSDSAELTALLAFVGVIAIFALVIPAAFRYMLAHHVLADQPDCGVFECVRQSKEMMAGHKWQAFKLVIPVILIMYGVMLAALLVIGLIVSAVGEAGAIGAVVSLLLTILPFCLTLFYSVRIAMCYCLFYLKRSGWEQPEEAA